MKITFKKIDFQSASLAVHTVKIKRPKGLFQKFTFLLMKIIPSNTLSPHTLLFLIYVMEQFESSSQKGL